MALEQKVYEGQIVKISIPLEGEDITAAPIKVIKVKDPNSVEMSWFATLEGTDTLTYTTAEGELTPAGTWKFMPNFPGWAGPGNTVELKVWRKFK